MSKIKCTLAKTCEEFNKLLVAFLKLWHEGHLLQRDIFKEKKKKEGNKNYSKREEKGERKSKGKK